METEEHFVKDKLDHVRIDEITWLLCIALHINNSSELRWSTHIIRRCVDLMRVILKYHPRIMNSLDEGIEKDYKTFFKKLHCLSSFSINQTKSRVDEWIDILRKKCIQWENKQQTKNDIISKTVITKIDYSKSLNWSAIEQIKQLHWTKWNRWLLRSFYSFWPQFRQIGNFVSILRNIKKTSLTRWPSGQFLFVVPKAGATTVTRYQ